METIKVNDRVKYTGKTNDWTFTQDLYNNSIGTIISVFENERKISYQVEFENGITASIDIEDLEKLAQN